MATRHYLIAFFLLFWANGAFAEEVESPPVPEVLIPLESGDELMEPEVTITETERGVEKQYSVNGQVYMVEVTPSSGPPYYLLDLDYDGQLDVQVSDIQNPAVQQWILFSW